jgi:GDP-4-dehydro-6-deoxy-D-mannose reductase
LIERERPHWVIQCAGVTHSRDPGEMYRLHVDGTLAVLSAVARFAPEATVVLLGSAAEYGSVLAQMLPLQETCREAPTSWFGASKLAQTHLAQAAAAQWQLSLVSVRPFNIIGPGLPDHYFAAAVARRLLRMRSEGGPAEFPVTNLHDTRDFVDVRDVASAFVALLLSVAATPGKMQIYNIATGIETPLSAVAAKLGSLAGGFQPVAGGADNSRSGVRRSCGDATRLRTVTDWMPQRTWEESIEDMWHSLQTKTVSQNSEGNH